MGAECSKLRQPMRAILALSRAQLLLIVVTRSRDLSRECHVTKHKTPARSNFPMFNFENSGTIQFSSSRSTSRGLCPKNFEKRAHPTAGHPRQYFVNFWPNFAKSPKHANFGIWPPKFFEYLNQKSASYNKGFSILKRF